MDDGATPARLPNLARALEAERATWCRRTFRYARHIARCWQRDESFGFWLDHLDTYDRHHRPRPLGVLLAFPGKEANHG